MVKAPKSSHITAILRFLDWLKINERIEYKLSLITYLQSSHNQPRCTVIWATRRLGDRRLGDKFFPNVHLDDTKLDVWATRTRHLGDNSKSLNLGQPHRPASCTRSLGVIICFSTHFSKVHRNSEAISNHTVGNNCQGFDFRRHSI